MKAIVCTPLHFARQILPIVLAVTCVVAFAGPAFSQKKKKKLPSQKFKGYGGLPDAVKKRPENQPRVTPVNANRKEECREIAARIDALVEANLADLGIEPNANADDYVFARRAYLDCTGTIPTMKQTNAYATDKNGRKHEMLVDKLLSSPGYVSTMYNYWANILRIHDRPNNNIVSYPYRDWVKDQIRTNRPYDKWVYDMLTAEGKIWENPAVGYALRDNGMPLVHVDNTVRVFLGTQIGCAQCHDHPFDKWTQKEFYNLAAYNYTMTTRDGGGSPAFKNGNPVARVRKELEAEGKRLNGNLSFIVQSNLFRVQTNPKRALRLPHDYAYDNGKPKEVVKPSLLWGDLPAGAEGKPPRHQYAAWMTSPENPRFAKTIANRLWKKVMGVGLIEPVDDIQDDTESENDELMDFLTQEMVRLKFDQKEFIRTLMYTKTYRRASSDFDPSEQEFYHYPGPRLRRMTPEQVWDSILTIAVYNPTSYDLPSTSQFAEVTDVDLATVTSEDVKIRAEKYNESVSPGARNKIMNSAKYRGQVLARASELPSPLPAGHFLRQFGQCDRETIEGDTTDPTVPQILTMFNGPFTHMMLEEGSVIYDSLSSAASTRDALDVMFLSILNRKPTTRDRDIALGELNRGDRAMGYGNVVWALINTREFLFVQ